MKLTRKIALISLLVLLGTLLYTVYSRKNSDKLSFDSLSIHPHPDINFSGFLDTINRQQSVAMVIRRDEHGVVLDLAVTIFAAIQSPLNKDAYPIVSVGKDRIFLNGVEFSDQDFVTEISALRQRMHDEDSEMVPVLKSHESFSGERMFEVLELFLDCSIDHFLPEEHYRVFYRKD